jgi:hypothetical protein
MRRPLGEYLLAEQHGQAHEQQLLHKGRMVREPFTLVRNLCLGTHFRGFHYGELFLFGRGTDSRFSLPIAAPPSRKSDLPAWTFGD